MKYRMMGRFGLDDSDVKETDSSGGPNQQLKSIQD